MVLNLNDRFGKATMKGIKGRQHQVMEVDLQLAQLDTQTARGALTAEGIPTHNFS